MTIPGNVTVRMSIVSLSGCALCLWFGLWVCLWLWMLGVQCAAVMSVVLLVGTSKTLCRRGWLCLCAGVCVCVQVSVSMYDKN